MTIRPMFLPVHDQQALASVRVQLPAGRPVVPGFYCVDRRANLRWRITPHPIHGGFFVLTPRPFTNLRLETGDVLVVGWP